MQLKWDLIAVQFLDFPETDPHREESNVEKLRKFKVARPCRPIKYL